VSALLAPMTAATPTPSEPTLSRPAEAAGRRRFSGDHAHPVWERGAVRARLTRTTDLPLGHIELGPPTRGTTTRRRWRASPSRLIGHEVGQYQIFPNFDEAPKYKGRAGGAEFPGDARASGEGRGCWTKWKDFLRASGALSVLCYREGNRGRFCARPAFAVFQLLDIQDYPGQGTALVGILERLHGIQGRRRAGALARVLQPDGPLLSFDKYVWTTAESFRADALLSHFGTAGLANASVAWTLTDGAGKVVRSGNLAAVLGSAGKPGEAGHGGDTARRPAGAGAVRSGASRCAERSTAIAIRFGCSPHRSTLRFQPR